MENETGETVEMPMGMAMSIAMNSNAMNAFCRLSDSQRTELINRAKTAKSRDEMAKIVGELAEMR